MLPKRRTPDGRLIVVLLLTVAVATPVDAADQVLGAWTVRERKDMMTDKDHMHGVAHEHTERLVD